MAEMMAFGRRHAPRQSDGTVENRRHSLTPTGHGAADPEDHSSRDQRTSAVVVMTSHSKKRREKTASSAVATTGASTGERKMSGAQLRLFFLLCVAVYFSVICFADDIVRFATWMSDEGPVVSWQAPSATPQSGRTTPKPAQPPRTGDKKQAAELVVVKGDTQTEMPVEKAGNLRGGENVKTAEASTPQPKEEQTPVPQPSRADEETKQSGEKHAEGAVSAATAPVLSESEDQRGEVPQESPLNPDEDAPLESVDNDGHNALKETTAEPPEIESKTMAVPAQIPDLGLVDELKTEQPKEELGAQVEDTATKDPTHLPETPQLIQAT